MKNQEGSSSYFQEQIRQPIDEYLLLALKEEIKRIMRLYKCGCQLDANMIADMGANSKNLNREMYVIMERTVTQAQELEKVINE